MALAAVVALLVVMSLCGGGSAAAGSCAALNAAMVLCDGSCVAPRSCSEAAAQPTAGPRTVAACAQLAPLGAFAGCAQGFCAPAVAACPPAVIARVVSVVPIAPAALRAELLRRYAGRVRATAAQVNCTVVLRGMPGEATDYTSSGGALRFSIERGIATPVGLSEAAVTAFTVGAGRRRQLQTDAGRLQLVATVVGPTDFDLSGLAASSYVVRMAAAVARTTQQLASGGLVVAGGDCGAGACAGAAALAAEIQSAATNGMLSSTVQFVHRFDITNMVARGGAEQYDPRGSAAELTPQVIQDIVAAATGASRAGFEVAVDTGQNLLPPPPSEDTELVDDTSSWLTGPASVGAAVSVGSLLCLSCVAAFCCMVCRRSARVGGVKDTATGVGMARARAKAEQARRRASAATLGEEERGQP